MANHCRRISGASFRSGLWRWRRDALVMRFILAAFALLILKPMASHAQASTCIEDGGQAVCREPDASDYSGNYAEGHYVNGLPEIYYVGLGTEQAIDDLIVRASAPCDAGESPKPPYVWTPVPYNGSEFKVFRVDISATIYSGPNNDLCKTAFPITYFGHKQQRLSCPVGWQPFLSHGTSNHAYGYCYIAPVQTCQKGQLTQCAGDPIDLANGNEREREVDFRGSASIPLEFIRTYNYTGAMTGPGAPPGAIGQGWSHTYERRIWFYPGGAIRVLRPDGNHKIFQLIGGAYQEFGTAADSLAALSSGGWKFVTDDDTTELYDAAGNLLSIIYRGGQAVALTYSTSSTPSSVAPYPGLLVGVADPFGHQLSFTYNSQAQIVSMTDPNGAVYTYSYTGSLLSSVLYPDSTSKQYLYNEAGHTSNTNIPYALTGVVDEGGVRYATINYNANGQAIASSLAGGVDQYSVSFGGPMSASGGLTVYVIDPLGRTRQINHMAVNGVAKFWMSSVLCTTCGDMPAKVTYDANGNVASRVDFNSRTTTYSYDLNRNLETSRTEASGTASARTITTGWDPNWREPALITELNRSTAYTYDSSGSLLTRTITDTSVSPNFVRKWSNTYDSYGRVLTATGPRTDVNSTTTYAYYTCTTGNQCGQVQTVTNAAGQTTTYNTYNAYGQPLTITDANGIVTTLTYDVRQRLTSLQVGPETTAFAYWPTGLLKSVTLPDGGYLLYTYDGAHRLTQISDTQGNKIVYTLDAIGNRTAENAYDPSGTLHRTHTRAFNTLNQLYQEINSAGTAVVTTTFGYDANGNQTTISAPLTRNTTNVYDELSRLKQITDPGQGITKFGYDANDNLTSVVDPRNLTTSYTYNGFGDVTSQGSPDTGATVNTYDSAGNLATSTDARGAVSTYTYDALNRVTSVAYSMGGSTDQALAFTYDTGTNGVGHLTGASDANHALSWGYDALGRVISKSQTVNGVTKSVGYVFTSGDLTTLITPSGQMVTYGYNANHQVTSMTVNGTTVLNNVTYEPLGPVNGWTWGNATTTARTYTQDGAISQISSNGVKNYTYDNALRITGITDTSTGSANWTYGYDALDRITSGTSASVARGWTYDANGNRRTETGSSPSTYTISPSSNRISSITGSLARTYGYDAAGNTTSYSSMTATYNDAGRLKTVSNGSSTETLIYDALGHRIETSGGAAGTVLYWYDEQGHLLGEYDGSGNLIEETVWLGDTPVATLRPNGSSVALYYVHTDQLNTPRQVTRPSDNAQMWTWYSDPFGTDATNANPAGVGSFAYNLRFPGQVFDGQVGLHSNGARDYDPAVGRYVESDPIGLMGGTNTYTYVRSKPLTMIDPDGLDALVVVGGRRTDSWNVFGHASIAISGAGLYSFGTGNTCGDAVGDFLREQSRARDQFMFRIKTSPAQDQEMLKYLSQFSQCQTVPRFPDNCAGRTENALKNGGISLTNPLTGSAPTPFPASLLQSLLTLAAAGGAQEIDVPRGSPVPDFSDFERH